MDDDILSEKNKTMRYESRFLLGLVHIGLMHTSLNRDLIQIC